MASPIIKEYIIKITAEAKEAQREIDKLAESFSGIGIKNKFDLNLDKQTSSIQGSIGKITEQMVLLRKSFDEGFNAKSMTTEFENLSRSLRDSIDSLTQSFNGFQKTFEGLNSGAFNASLDAFTSQMASFFDAYKELFPKLEGMDKGKSGEKLVPQMSEIKDAVTKQRVTIEEAKKEQEKAKSKLLAVKEAQEEINSVVAELNKNRKNIENASGSGVRKTRTGQRWMTKDELENAEDIIQRAIRISNKYKNKNIDGIDIQEMLFKPTNTTAAGLERTKESIVNNIEEAVKRSKQVAIDNLNKDNSDQKTDIQFGISIHPDAISEKAISEMVKQIRSQVIEKINERLKGESVKIPIGLAAAHDTKEEAEAALSETVDNKGIKGIQKTLYVDVKANVNGLAQQIDTEIKKINKDITQTIDVKIRPIVPTPYELTDAIADVEEKLGGKTQEVGYTNGIPIDISRLNLTTPSNTFDEQSHTELVNIRDLVQKILNLLSGRFVPGTPGSIPPVPPITPTQTTGHPDVTDSRRKPTLGGDRTQQNIQEQHVNTQRIEQSTPPRGQKPILNRQTNPSTPSTTPPVGQPSNDIGKTSSVQKQGTAEGQVADTFRKATFSFDNFVKYLMRGRRSNGLRIAQDSQNYRTSAERYGRQLLAEGMRAFLNDLKNPNRTLQDVQGKSYFNQSYESQNKQLAFYGKTGQTLEDFQKDVSDVFTVTHKEIEDFVSETQKTFKLERTDTELVDSGVEGAMVTKWMKRIIDDDYYQEDQDIKGSRFKRRMASMNQADPGWGAKLRKEFLAEPSNELSTLENIYNSTSAEVGNLYKQERAYENELAIQIQKYERIKGSQAQADQDLAVALKKEIDESKKKIAETRERIDTLEEKYNFPEQERRIATAKGVVERIGSMSDEEILKEQIRKEHKKRRSELAAYTGQITEEFDAQLEGIQERLIKRTAGRKAKDAIEDKFGKSALKGSKDYGIAMTDVKNPQAQKRIRDLERNGMVVDEKTGNIVSFKTPKISRQWTYEDTIQRMETVREIAQSKLEEQQQITEVLSEGSQDLNDYISSYERHLNGTSTPEDDQIILTLREQIAERAYYLANQEEINKAIAENEKIQRKMASGKATNEDRTLYTKNEQFIQQYASLTEQQVYELAKQQEQMIADSIEQERFIKNHYKSILTEMANSDATRFMSKKTYEENKKGIVEDDKIIAKYRSRVRNTDTGADTSQLTPWEADEYWGAVRDKQTRKRKVLGYEFGNGIRDFSKRLIGHDAKELIVDNMSVTNLGLSAETSNAYAKVPAARAVSELYRNEEGRIQYDQTGNPMLSAVGKTQEELQSFVQVLGHVINEVGAQIAALPTDQEQLREIAVRQVEEDIKGMRERLAIVDEELVKRYLSNMQRETEIEQGKEPRRFMSVKGLEEERASLISSIGALSTDTASTKRVATIRKDRAELDKLQKEETELIGRYQRITGISDEVVGKIEALAQARKDRKQIYSEYRDVGDLIGSDYKVDGEVVEGVGRRVNKKEVQSKVVDAVNRIITGVFGEDALASFNYKAITGYDYNSVEELVQHFDDLESLLRMYDDIVAEAEAALKKVLPKGKADALIQEAGVKTTDQYGQEVYATETGELLDRLLDNRKKQEELLGEIRKNEYDMQREGEKEQSLREARIEARISQMQSRRRELIGISESAVSDRKAYQQMLGVEREKEANAAIRRQKDAERQNTLKQIDEVVAMPKETRIEQVKAENEQIQADIKSELDKQNDQLVSQRKVIIDTYVQAEQDLKQKTAALVMSQAELERAQSTLPSHIIPSEEDVLMEDASYAALVKEMKAAEEQVSKMSRYEGFTKEQKEVTTQIQKIVSAARSNGGMTGEQRVQLNDLYDQAKQLGLTLSKAGLVEPSGEYTQAREELTRLRQKVESSKAAIQTNLASEVDNLIASLDEAVTDGVSKEEIRNMANDLVQKYNKYLGLGIKSGINYLDVDDESYAINGRNPIQYAEDIITSGARQEVAEKERVVALAREELSVAEQVAASARRSYDYTTRKSLTDGGETLKRLQKELLRNTGLLTQAENKNKMEQERLNEANQKIGRGVSVPNYGDIKRNAEIAEQEYRMAQNRQKMLRSIIQNEQGANIDKEVDNAAVAFGETAEKMASLKSKADAMQQKLAEEIEAIGQGTDVYRKFLYNKYGVEPDKQKAPDEVRLRALRASQRESQNRGKKANQQIAFGVQADADRWSFGLGKVAEGKMMAAKARREQNKKQRGINDMWDSYFFADMTKEQAVLTKKIQRLVTQRNKRGLSQQGQAQLALLQQQARGLNLDVQDNGYVKPLVTSKEYRQNKSAHTFPHFTQQELINNGLLSAKDQYREWAEQAQETEEILTESMQRSKDVLGESVEPPKPDFDGADEYYSKMSQGYVDMSEEMMDTQERTTQQMNNNQQEQLQEAEKMMKRYRDAVAAKNLQSGDYKEQLKAKYNEYATKVKSRQMIPEFAADELERYFKQISAGSASSQGAERSQSPISSGGNDTDIIIESEERVGNAAEEATEKVLTLYRAFNTQHGISGKNGISWFGNDIGDIGTYLDNARTQKDAVAKLLLQNKNGMLSIDAGGKSWDNILYDGAVRTTEQIAEMAKQAGYLGVEFKNIQDNYNGIGTGKGSIFAIFDENILKSATEDTKAFRESLSELSHVQEYAKDALYQFNGRPLNVYEEVAISFDNIVERYKDGAMDIKQVFSEIDNEKNRILSKDKRREDFTNTVKDLWGSLKSQSAYADDIYKGFGKNNVWKATLQGFLDGTIEEQKALQDLEIEFRRVLELSNETQGLFDVDNIENLIKNTESAKQKYLDGQVAFQNVQGEIEEKESFNRKHADDDGVELFSTDLINKLKQDAVLLKQAQDEAEKFLIDTYNSNSELFKNYLLGVDLSSVDEDILQKIATQVGTSQLEYNIGQDVIDLVRPEILKRRGVTHDQKTNTKIEMRKYDEGIPEINNTVFDSVEDKLVLLGKQVKDGILTAEQALDKLNQEIFAVIDKSISGTLREDEVFEHLGSSSLDPTKFNKIQNSLIPSAINKPGGGFWATPISPSGNEWAYIASEMGKSEEELASYLAQKFSFRFKEDAKVLVIESLQDIVNLPRIKSFIDPLTQKEVTNGKDNKGNILPDWELISRYYDGIVVRINDGRDNLYNALYGWDIDSAVVTNPNAIEPIKSNETPILPTTTMNDTTQHKQITTEIKEQAKATEELAQAQSKLRPEKYQNVDISALTDKELKNHINWSNTALRSRRSAEKDKQWRAYQAELFAERDDRERKRGQIAQKPADYEYSDADIIFETDAVVPHIREATQAQQQLEEQTRATTASLREQGAVASGTNIPQQEEYMYSDKDIVFETDAVIHSTVEATQAQQQLAHQADITTDSLMRQNSAMSGEGTPLIETGVAQEQQLENAVRNTTSAIQEQNATLQDGSTPITTGLSAETSDAASQAGQLADNMQRAADASANAATNMNRATSAQQQIPTNTTGTTTALPLDKTSNMAQEASEFDRMNAALDGINPKIATKNSLLSEEARIVSQEASSFGDLISKLEKVVSLASQIKFEFNFKGTDQLNEQFIKGFTELSRVIEGVDVSKFDSVSKVLEGLQINKSIGQNFKALGDGIKAFQDQLTSGGGIAGNNLNDLVNLIDRISAAGEHIANMSDVLKNSAKAQQGLFGMKYSQDPQIEEQMNEYMKLMDYISNPKNITRNAYLELQERNYENGIGNGVATKDIAWYSDYQEKYKQAQQLYAMLSQIDTLEGNARNLLNKRMSSYDKTVGEVQNSMENEYKRIAFEAKQRVEQIEASLDANTYGKGITALKQALDEVTVVAANGKMTIEEYKEAVNKAFADFNKLQRVNNVAFGNLKSQKIMDTPDGYTQENARQYAEEYINQNYKKNLSGVAETTKIVDGEQVSIFTARVQDANGMVQNLRMAWSDVTGEIRVATSEVSKTQTGIDSMLSAVTGKLKGLYAYWGAQLFNPYRLIGYAKQLINVVKTYDTAMMEMRKVSTEATSTLAEFQEASFGVANQVGTTAATIQQSAASWMRLGKSLQESAEASKASAWLVNVSEFTSIDDATSSLISLRQAFQDLSYEDFIDKLNGVGDSFSSSTTDLAKGMQNVAAVLKTNGNDLDQSLALLTAANDITQDISKASMGVRTVALRISGTQEAKQELEEEGEDVSDFIVQTQSKVDAQVRKYTATSKNPNGVSVLDSTGRLRDTYDILLDISKVYDEIVAKDNEFGTNTSNALLELLAGKTRSNVLASILQNPQLLEDAYETSKNSQGVGQKELDVYLDSIEARQQKIKNSLEELLTNIVDSESFKVLLDLINEIIQGANTLVKTFGGLKTILGAIAGIKLQRSGLGILSTAKGAGWLQLLGGKPSQTQIAQALSPLQSQVKNFFQNSDFDMGGNFFEQMAAKGFDSQALYKSEMFGPMLNSMKEAEAQELTMGKAQELLNQRIGILPTTVSQAGASFSNFTGILKGLTSSALTTIAVMAGMTIIQGVAQWIYDYATSQQRAIEAGKEAQAAIEATKKSYDEQKKSITSLQEEYAKLSTGVQVDGNNVKNLNLSEEEFARYLDISKQLAELAPELVTGYDNQGNAIVNLGNTVESVNSQLNEFLNTQRDLANVDIGGNLDKTFKGIENEVIRYRSKAQQFEGNTEQSEEQESFIGIFNKLGNSQKQVSKGTRAITVKEDDYNDFRNLLIETGGYVGSSEFNPETKLRTFTVDFNDDDIDLERINGFYNSSKAGAAKDTRYNEAQARKYQLLIESTYKKAIPAIQSYLDTTFMFDDLAEPMQEKFRSGMSTLFSKIDYASVQKDIEAEGGLERWVDSVITSMMATDETQDAFINLTELAEKRGEMTYQQIMEARRKYFDIIIEAFRDEETGESLFDRNQLAVLFGYATAETDQNGKTTYKGIASSRISSASTKLGLSEEDANLFSDKLKEAYAERSDSALTAIESLTQSRAKEIGKNWEKYVEPYLNGEKTRKDINTGTLKDIFNSEGYKEDAEQFESDLSSINGALEKYRTQGKLTADEAKSLRESLKIGDITEDNLNKLGTEKLQQWVSELYKQADAIGLTKEEMAGLNNYIRDLYLSYGELSVSTEDASFAMIDTIAGEHMDASIYDRAKQMQKDIYSAIGDVDEDIIYYLSLNPDAATWTAEEWLAHYRETEVEFKLTANEQELQNIEKLVQGNEKDISREEARNSLKEANNEILTPQDYDVIVGKAGENASARREYATNLLTQWENQSVNSQYDQKYKDKLWDDYIAADTLALQAEADLAEKEKVQKESSVNEINQRINDAKSAASVFQASVKKADATGKHAGEQTYNLLSQQLTKEANLQRDLYAEYMDLATKNPQFASDFKEKASAALETAIDLDAQAFDAETAPISNYIDDLINNGIDGYEAFNNLQRDATEIENELSEADAKHQKASGKLYKSLIDNGDKQIKNLTKQREKWVELQGKATDPSKWRDFQNEINSIDDSITQMRQNQLGWADTMTSIVSTNAATLSSTLSTAFQEINSETGLTIDTMNELERQLGDLSGRDVSNIFYQSADGMKFNADAAEDLIDAEYLLQTNNLYNAIAEQKSIIDELGSSEDASAQASVSAAEQRINAYDRELAMLQAQYDQQKDLLSARAAWEAAQQTPNAGANYEAVYDYLKTQKENASKGLTGTDEFKAYTKYWSPIGLDTFEEWERMAPKAERYAKEGIAGVINLMDDLTSAGLATKDENGLYSLKTNDRDLLADAAGISTEAVTDIMDRGEDFGAFNVFVESQLDGMMQLQDLTEEYTETVLRLNEAERKGASEEVLDNIRAKKDELLEQMDAVKEATDVVSEHEGQVSRTSLNDTINDINALNAGITKDMSPEMIEQVNKQIQQKADEGGVILKFDAELGRLVVDEEAMQKAYPEYNIPIKPDWDSFEFDEDMAPVAKKIEEGWSENNTQLQGYLDTLSNLNDEDLKKLEEVKISNGGYEVEESLHGAEDALQGIADMFGLSAEEGNQLLDILRQIGLFDGTLDETYYNKYSPDNTGNLGVETGGLQTYLSQNKQIGTDLNFDAQSMSMDELYDKMIELKTLAHTFKVEPDVDPKAKKELDELIDACEQEYSLKVNTEAVTDANGVVIKDQSGKEISKERFVANENGEQEYVKQQYQAQLGLDGTKFDEQWNAKKQEVENEVLVAKVQAVMQSEGVSAEELSGMSDQQLIDIGFTTENLDEVRSAIDQIKQDAATITIRIADDQLNQLIGETGEGTDMTITANNTKAKQAADEAETYIKGKQPQMYIQGNNTGAITAANNAAVTISAMNPALNITAKSEVLKTSINNALLGPFTINIKANVTGLPRYTGTMLAPAQASGTGYNVLNTIPLTGAFADGKVGLKENEEALVNELGTESVIRDGKWFLLPGGMHTEQLKKGDIVLNHLQTKSLIEGGRAFGHGKAYAQGSVPLASIPLGPAHGDAGKYKIGTKATVYSGDKPQTVATNNNTDAVRKATNSTDKNTAQQKKTSNALTKFQKGLANLKDWIEVRLNYRDYQIDLSQARSENATTYQKKNDTKDKNKLNALSAAQSWNRTKLKELEKAEGEYDKQIKKVRDLAVSSGLLKKGRADELLKKALTGSVGKKLAYDIEQMKGLIDSNGKAVTSKMTTKKQKSNSKSSDSSDNYTSKELAYVEALEEWINKMREATKAVEEAKQKIKEFAQMRLDNITEQADALVSYAESLQGISDSYINLATIRGKNAVNDKVFKREYDSQMEQQNFITGYLRGEYKAYQKELNNAAKDFGVNSNEYHAALAKFNEIQSAIYDSEEKYYELRKEKAELEFTAISQVVDRIKSVSQLITGRSNLMSKTDNENVRKGSTNPQTFIDFNARQIQLNNGLAEQWKKQWDEAVEYMGTTQLTNENAKEYQEYYNKAIEAETEILGILENQEELKKNIRDLRWQGFEKLQENIQNAISDYDHLRDLMRESQSFDWEFGIEMQPEGYANISLIANSMERAKQQIKDYRRALELLNEDYKNGNITQTEFNEKSREYVEIIQNSAKAVSGYEDELVNMYQKQIQAENDLLISNINKRKEALQAKKA